MVDQPKASQISKALCEISPQVLRMERTEGHDALINPPLAATGSALKITTGASTSLLIKTQEPTCHRV